MAGLILSVVVAVLISLAVAIPWIRGDRLLPVFFAWRTYRRSMPMRAILDESHDVTKGTPMVGCTVLVLGLLLAGVALSRGGLLLRSVALVLVLVPPLSLTIRLVLERVTGTRGLSTRLTRCMAKIDLLTGRLRDDLVVARTSDVSTAAQGLAWLVDNRRRWRAEFVHDAMYLVWSAAATPNVPMDELRSVNRLVAQRSGPSLWQIFDEDMAALERSPLHSHDKQFLINSWKERMATLKERMAKTVAAKSA